MPKFLSIMRPVLFFLSLLSIIYSVGQAKAINANQSLLIENKRYSLELLQQKLKPLQVTIAHQPVYKNSPMGYYAFDMNTVLERLLRIDFNKDNHSLLLQVKTIDQYLSYIAINDFIKKGKAYLAFRQSTTAPFDPSDDKKWTLIRAHGQVFNPGPFYLVWNTPTTYPVGWPFQITELKIVKKSDLPFNQVFNPKGNDKSLNKGHELFLKACSACHSIYYQGPLGKAPDLGKIANYLTDSDISKIIKNGRNYMPPIGAKYSEDEIKNVLEYLHWINDQKIICHPTK